MNVRSIKGEDTTWIDMEWVVSAYDWKLEDLMRWAFTGGLRIYSEKRGEIMCALSDVIATLGMPSYNKRN